MIPDSPYTGLRAFDDSELDALFFFGRERETEIVIANVIASQLTVLYGPSGVGKSSLLRAGVARSLRELPGDPIVIVFSRWAQDPAGALSDVVTEAVGRGTNGALVEALERAQVDRDVYLLLDQAEEYFLYHSGDGDEFAEALPAAVTRPLRVNVLLSVREDSLAKLHRFAGRIPTLFGNVLRLDRLGRTAGEAAVIRPVERFNELAGTGITVERAFVERLLEDVKTGQIETPLGGAGAVASEDAGVRIEAPYLQLVVQRVWEEERSGGSDVLRAETLERLGGAQRIVSGHLESAIGELTPGQRDVAARLFNHLVTPGGTKIAHRRDDLAGFGGVAPADLDRVLEPLTNHRIVRAFEDGGDVRYEIFHDVLAQPVLAWRARHRTERLIEREREAGRRRHKRLVVLAIGALVALAGMTAVALYALDQRNYALDQRSIARERADAARARELVARATFGMESDPQEALRLAVEAARLEPGQQTETALRASLLAARARMVVLTDGPAVAGELSPDGRRLLVAGAHGRVRIIGVQPRRRVYAANHGGPLAGAALDGRGRFLTWGQDGVARLWQPPMPRPIAVMRHGRPVRWAGFAPGGGLIATASGRTVRFWTPGGQLWWIVRLPTDAVEARFSSRARLLAIVGNDRYVRLVDVTAQRVVRTLDQGGRTTAVAFSPRQPLLATAGENDVVRVWHTSTGRLVRELRGHEGTILVLEFGPRGSLLAAAGTDGIARLWRISTGTLASQVGHSNHVTSIAFSANGSTFATASRDRTARVWNVEDAIATALLAGHGDSVRSIAFAREGNTVVTTSDDGTVQLWNREAQPKLSLVLRRRGFILDASPRTNGRSYLVVGPGRSTRVVRADGGVQRTIRHSAAVSAAAESPDGSIVAVAGRGTLALFRSGSDLPARVLRQPARITAVDVSADGAMVATAGRDGMVRIWGRDGSAIRRFDEGVSVTDVAFHPDGTVVAAAGVDGSVRIWRVADARLLHTLSGHSKTVTSVSWSANGDQVVTAGLDRDARVWDGRSGALIRILRFHYAVVSEASFSPDGRWIVTAGPVTAQLWRSGSAQPVFPFGLGGHGGRLTSAEWTMDGRFVVTSSLDGTVRRWACVICGSVPHLIELAEARLRALEPV
jgi:WD40 repeat protein/DNA-binding transcriptional ArsR family regulator